MTTVVDTDRIERSVVINAPRERVWRALSDAESFGTWFGADLKGQVFAPGQRARGSMGGCGHENVFFDVVVERGTDIRGAVVFLEFPDDGRGQVELPGDGVETLAGDRRVHAFSLGEHGRATVASRAPAVQSTGSGTAPALRPGAAAGSG